MQNAYTIEAIFSKVCFFQLLCYLQDDDMNKVTGFLGSTMKKLKHISRGGYCRMYFYLALFCCAVFFVMYILIRLG